MKLQMQSLNINFAQGLDTKTDPFQVQPGKFLSLQNTIFTKAGLLQKRYGFAQLTSLPNASNSYLTTFNTNLTAIGNTVTAFSQGNNRWITRGFIAPLELSVIPLIRNNTNQTQVDTSLSVNGTVCTVYTDSVSSGSGVTSIYKYAIADSETGQNVVAPTVITSPGFTVLGAPRVFSLANYFMIVYPVTSGSGAARLQYTAINQANPTQTSSATSITTNFSFSTQGSFDGVVANNSLYLSWAGAANSGVKSALINSVLTQSTTVTIASQTSTILSVTADNSASPPNIWTSAYVIGTNSGIVVATDSSLNTLFSARQFVSSSTAQITNLASTATEGWAQVLYEVSNPYSYGSGSQTNYIKTVSCTNTGSLSASSNLIRSVGLASKGFLIGSMSYYLTTYSSNYQPTYFLVNGSASIVAKVAYQNGGGYLPTGLPSVSVNGNTASFPYLFKDLVQAVNKDTNVAAGTQTAGIYSQIGVNLAKVNFTTDSLASAEIGANLNLTGGFLWSYDGYSPVEQNFFVYPDNISVTTIGSGGALSAQTYYYQVTYEWSDNNGNLFRSAPSIPVSIIVGSATSTNTINIPTLRLTYKTANPVKIVLYRWSTAQQEYYQVTSITQPVLNNTTIDSVTITDTSADATILGNNLIYTTGGVVEDVNPPACSALTLFQSRLWLVDSEDPNLLWFSKVVVEATPVEMSDLFTVFIAPTTGAQGSTGPITALSSMDDKLIIFKSDAIYYLNGSGPDNTGANGGFSDPVFITSTVGCINPKSIVFTPQGLMFQSNKGIWILGRDLSTMYIGAPVDKFNKYKINSALNIPGTNQVRFTLNNGTTLMYDYFYGQWGTFVNVPAISSTLYQKLHTYINSFGQVFQENQNSYLDGANPVLISFTTSWMNLAGLQGFERAYFFYLLATYLSPHKLQIQIAYDYSPGPSQSLIIMPDNFSPTYGTDTIYGGGSPYGGQPSKEQWRVFLEQQKCQAFQITLNEIFDPSMGAPAGAGFTLSGLDLVVSIKGQYPRIPSSKGTG